MKNVLIALLMLFAISAQAQEVSEKFRIANQALEDGNYAKAERLFGEIIEIDPKFSRAYYSRGLARLYDGKIDESIEDFNKSIKLDAKFPDAYNGRGLAYQIMGNLDKALVDFEKASSLDPTFGEAAFNKAQTLFALERIEESKVALDQAMKFTRDNPKTHALAGDVNYRMGNYVKSIEQYSKAIKLGEESPEIYEGRANAYYNSGEFQKALMDFDRILRSQPENTRALNNRALTYIALGDTAAAERDYDKLIKIRKAMFPDIKTMRFKTYTSPDSIFTIDLPVEWNIWDNVTESGDWQVIVSITGTSPNDFNPFSVGAYIYMERNVDKKYPVENETEMLYYWEEKRKELNLKYSSYELNEKKSYTVQGKPAIRNLVTIQPVENSDYVGVMETAIVINENLIHIYPQTPIDYWEVFQPVFLKIVESVHIN